MNLDVRERSHYLLLGREIGALLELEVTDGTRQCQVAVDASKVDKASCGLDAGFLGCAVLENPSNRRAGADLRSAACGRKRGVSPCP